jgi:hypothetical protein
MKKILVPAVLCLLLSGIGLVWLTSCSGSGKGSDNQTETPTSVITVKAPNFNGDSAYFFVDKQVSFGPRVPNTNGHRKCGDYLIETLKKYDATVTVQEFVADAYDGSKLQSRNIVGSFFPDAPKRILLAAHWDTRHIADKDSVRKNEPIDGANDGGSGVGVLLEVARVLHTAPGKPGVGVDIIFFDSEDYGEPSNAKPEDFPKMDPQKQYYCLGSQYWGKTPHKPGYSAYYGILLDMVGAKNARFPREGSSMQYARSIVDKVWAIAQPLGYGNYFIDQVGPEVGADDHTYINLYAKIPTIDILEFDNSGQDYFGDYHHTHADNMQIIDKNTLKAVGQTVVQTLYEEGAGSGIQ